MNTKNTIGGQTRLKNYGGSFKLFFVCSPQCAPTALLTAAHRRRWACSPQQSASSQQRWACSPMSVRIFAALIYNFVLIIQFLTDLIPHRCSTPFYFVRIRCTCSPPLCSVRMLTIIAHHHSIQCAFSAHAHRCLYACSLQPAVHIRWACAPNAHRCSPFVHPPNTI